MICPDCKAAARKVCADHHRTTNIEDDADREIDRLRARVAELEAALQSARTEERWARGPRQQEIIALAVAEEREACVAILQRVQADYGRGGIGHAVTVALEAIKARGGGA